MAARRVRSGDPVRSEAQHVRATLVANTHPMVASDPLRLRRDALDAGLRTLRSQRKVLVEAVD
jgi:hypothetical protein